MQYSWAGLRTFAADLRPVIGYYGIQSAPAVAQLAAALAWGEPVPAPIAAEGVTAEAVSPTRFASRNLEATPAGSRPELPPRGDS